MNDKRIVYTDPGLLSPEQLLENAGGRRRSLEYIIARHSNKKKKTFSDYALEWKEAGTWFLDHARVKISVSFHSFAFPAENKWHVSKFVIDQDLNHVFSTMIL